MIAKFPAGIDGEDQDTVEIPIEGGRIVADRPLGMVRVGPVGGTVCHGWLVKVRRRLHRACQMYPLK
jgi:hypothetical protein